MAAERESDKVDVAQRGAVENAVSLAKVLGAFSSLSRPYVDTTQEYYEDLAGTKVANVQSDTFTGTEYVKWASEKEEEERDRATQCFSSETAVEIVDVFRHVTGEMFADKIVRKGERGCWLELMYKLLTKRCIVPTRTLSLGYLRTAIRPRHSRSSQRLCTITSRRESAVSFPTPQMTGR